VVQELRPPGRARCCDSGRVADQGGAYWLLDEIALAQRGDRRVVAKEFQVWKLTVNPDRTATLTCDDGNGNIVSSKEIPFTDFPLDEIELWSKGQVANRNAALSRYGR
jgi:hypothetical protein